MTSSSNGRRDGPPNGPPAAAGWQKAVQPSDSHRQYSHRTRISTECTAIGLTPSDESGAPPQMGSQRLQLPKGFLRQSRRASALVEAWTTWIRYHTPPLLPSRGGDRTGTATGIKLLRGGMATMSGGSARLPSGTREAEAEGARDCPRGSGRWAATVKSCQQSVASRQSAVSRSHEQQSYSHTQKHSETIGSESNCKYVAVVVTGQQSVISSQSSVVNSQ